MKPDKSDPFQRYADKTMNFRNSMHMSKLGLFSLSPRLRIDGRAPRPLVKIDAGPNDLSYSRKYDLLNQSLELRNLQSFKKRRDELAEASKSRAYR